MINLEIRTPLTSILGWTEILLKEAADKADVTAKLNVSLPFLFVFALFCLSILNSIY